MIIGITGRIAAGKDTLGSLICKRSRKYSVKKFAEKLKQIASIMLSVPPESFENQAFKTKNLGYKWDFLTVRQFLQCLGTEIRKGVCVNAWVNSLSAEYDGGMFLNEKNWVITDVRFPNEAMMVKEKGGIIVRISRGQLSGKEKLKEMFFGHESEKHVDRLPCDIEVVNNGTVEQLERAAEIILNQTEACRRGYKIEVSRIETKNL
jgi:hypothetical protein